MDWGSRMWDHQPLRPLVAAIWLIVAEKRRGAGDFDGARRAEFNATCYEEG